MSAKHNYELQLFAIVEMPGNLNGIVILEGAVRHVWLLDQITLIIFRLFT